MDIQVGDLITYINSNDSLGMRYKSIMINSDRLIDYKNKLENKEIEIIKIERPVYEVIEEKKELLTEEEKEFLKDINKFFDITNMLFCDNSIGSYKCDEIIFYCDYPKGLKFEGIEKNKNYTLEELGIN